MNGKWFFAKDGRRFGPFTFEQFRQMAESALLAPTDMVTTEDDGRWVSAQAVPGLFGRPGMPAPPLAPAASLPLADSPELVPPEPRPRPPRSFCGVSWVDGKLVVWEKAKARKHSPDLIPHEPRTEPSRPLSKEGIWWLIMFLAVFLGGFYLLHLAGCFPKDFSLFLIRRDGVRPLVPQSTPGTRRSTAPAANPIAAGVLPADTRPDGIAANRKYKGKGTQATGKIGSIRGGPASCSGTGPASDAKAFAANSRTKATSSIG